jgi:hypothetical protein
MLCGRCFRLFSSRWRQRPCIVHLDSLQQHQVSIKALGVGAKLGFEGVSGRYCPENNSLPPLHLTHFRHWSRTHPHLWFQLGLNWVNLHCRPSADGFTEWHESRALFSAQCLFWPNEKIDRRCYATRRRSWRLISSQQSGSTGTEQYWTVHSMEWLFEKMKLLR